jgi:hypothetical protein
MDEPIIFISRNQIKEGKVNEFHQHYLQSIPMTLTTKLGTIVQLGYENKGSNEFTIVRLFPNAEALDHQLQGAEDRSMKTYEFIEPTGIEIFGTCNPGTIEKMTGIASKGILVKINPVYVGGFIR